MREGVSIDWEKVVAVLKEDCGMPDPWVKVLFSGGAHLTFELQDLGYEEALERWWNRGPTSKEIHQRQVTDAREQFLSEKLFDAVCKHYAEWGCGPKAALVNPADMLETEVGKEFKVATPVGYVTVVTNEKSPRGTVQLIPSGHEEKPSYYIDCGASKP